jgi:hypothetical protein
MKLNMHTTTTAKATNSSQLQLPLSRAESSLILEALVEKPFKQVFELIGALNHQAQVFYANNSSAAEVADAAAERKNFSLSPAEFHCCVTALGDLAYNRVQPLLAHMHTQLQLQTERLRD